MSSRRPHIILLLLILATIGGVFLFAAPQSPLYKPPALGLDLEGGLQVVLEARPSHEREVTSEEMARSVDIMRNRVDKLGVAEPDVRTQGSNQIVIDLPGVTDTKRALDVIGKTAELQIFDLETSLIPPSIENGTPQPNTLYPLLKAVEAQVKKDGVSGYYLFNAKHKLKDGPLSRAELSRTLKKMSPSSRKGAVTLAAPKATAVVSCDKETSRACPGLPREPKPSETFYYLFKTPPQLTGADLKASGIRADSGSNGPFVSLAFTGKGNKAFHEITREEYLRGQSQNTPQHNAIVLDNEMITFPQIDFTDSSLSDGIDPAISGAIIDHVGSMSEARDIATVLQTGALPTKFESIESVEISATLGQDSLRQALVASLVGLALVVIFLLAFYRFLGLVAVIGLGIFSVFLYGVILLFNVTLTLPGFAGMILTIGVAADANIVVFERIKEESRGGRSVKAAVSTGYARGFATILDANVVTAITAAVLFLVSEAGVKGFALMLLIGTGISLVTAVFGTRALLGLLSNFRWFHNAAFMGASGTKRRGAWMQIDFMRKRWLWLAVSGTIMTIGMVGLGLKGLNLGIDFKGGTQIKFATSQPTQLDEVRNIVVETTGERGATIVGTGKAVGGARSYKGFQIRLRSHDRNVQVKLNQQLESKVNAVDSSTTTVSSSFGSRTAKSAVTAILVSFFLIAIYVSMRFEFKFALPVIASVVHDMVVTVGVFALSGREVSTSTVAAVLTVIGYSIYDTIIIFDRIRENMPLMRQAPFARIVNVSLWETITRSLATTFITLLPVVALLVAGGDTLNDFAFALLVGIGSGAYSSFLVASPLLTMWKEREPEYARRLHAQDFQRQGHDVPLGKAAPQPALATVTEQSTHSDLMPAADDAAKRERRRQRRRSRPHGRPR